MFEDIDEYGERDIVQKIFNTCSDYVRVDYGTSDIREKVVVVELTNNINFDIKYKFKVEYTRYLVGYIELHREIILDKPALIPKMTCKIYCKHQRDMLSQLDKFLKDIFKTKR